MTIKELIESVKAGEIQLEEHPQVYERLFQHLKTLKQNQKHAPQSEMENYEYEINKLEDLLQAIHN